MERGFPWIVLVIQFTMVLATNSLSPVTVASLSTLSSSTPTSQPSSSTPTSQPSSSTPTSQPSSSTPTSQPSLSTPTSQPSSSTPTSQPSSSTPKSSQPTSTYSQNIPWSPSPSFICTSWFVKQGDCSEACSNVGGTVTETCQCSSNSVAISETGVCENYGLHTTRTKSCKERCPASGTNALGSLSWIAAVQCSLAMFILFT